MYYVFDVLHLDGHDLAPLPYATRRDVLTGLGLFGDQVKVPVNFLNIDGQTVLKAAELGGFKGVVAKRLASPYRAGKGSADWTKVPSGGVESVSPRVSALFSLLTAHVLSALRARHLFRTVAAP
jgi:hypothetical protein